MIERLTKASLAAADEADRAKSAFRPDGETPHAFRVHPNQFLKSGYDKGHLAPASAEICAMATHSSGFTH